MTAASRSMDDLDRLGFRLVRTIRQQYPELHDRGFSLADVEERLLPYREARREMADGGAASWERTVLRLLSGERRYVHAREEVALAARQALASPSPTLALVRQFSGGTLQVGEALRTAIGDTADESADRALAGSERGGSSASNGSASNGTNHDASSSAMHSAAPALLRAESGGDRPSRRASRCCRFCGGQLPEERRVTFCPHCGLDQTKRQCPACSTELEATWRFCVTCGRGADVPESTVELKRAAG